MTSSARDRATDALAGEVPAPAGDAPPLWWSPSRGVLQASATGFGVVLMVGHTGLTELPADAVPLVPAGGSAPAGELDRMRQDRDDWRSVAESYRRSLSKMPRAGGSAPHQGATTAALALHRQVIDSDWLAPGHCAECWVIGGDDYVPWPCPTVRALLGAATTTAPEATDHDR